MNRNSDINSNINAAADLILSSNYIVVLTGAGSSTPSGIPDFRSPDNGLWTRFEPMEVASLTSFRYSPEKFFEWLRPLARTLLEARPNPFHYAVRTLEIKTNLKTVITQNIDGLHQKAGSKAVIEVHGSIKTMSCIGCYRTYPSDDFILPYIDNGVIPTCAKCGCILKPNVILFEEQLPVDAWLKAKVAIDKCDLLIVAGSSLTVTPVAHLPIRALDNNAKVVLVNQTPTYIDDFCTIALRGDVVDIIPAITHKVLNTLPSISETFSEINPK